MVSERETMDNSLEGPQNGTATATAIPAAAAEDNETSDSTKKCVPRKKMIITVLLVSRMLSASIFPLLQTSYPLEAKLRGIGNTMISLVFGIYPLTNVFAPQIIKYALFYLKLRNIIFAGLILSSTNTVLFGMLKYIPNEGSYNKVFIVLSFIVRALDSIGCGAMSNAIMIYFATEFPDIMSTLFGFMQFSIGFGYATAPLFGGILYDHGGFVLPFLVYGVVLAICIPCSMYLLTTNTYKQIEEKSSDSKSTYSWQIFFNGLYITVLTVPYAFQDVFLGVHFQDFSFSQTELGIMYFILSLSFCLSSILNVRITYKVSDSKILFIVSNIIFVGVLLLCGPSPLLGIEHKYIWLDVVSLTLFGLFYNLSTTISYRDINEIIAGGTTEQTLQEASTINSIYYTSEYLGQLTGFLVAGTMLNTFGYNWSLTIMGLIIFLTTFILIYQRLSKCLPNIGDLRNLWNNTGEGNHLLNSNTH